MLVPHRFRRVTLASLKAILVAKACDHALTLWSRLSRFLEYPELELSNNLAENAMRPVALCRRNWIHVGSKEAGPRVAAIISIVETCRRLSLPLRDYLSSVQSLVRGCNWSTIRLRVAWSAEL